MSGSAAFNMSGAPAWPDPDMSVMRLNRRPPPPFPLVDTFGPKSGLNGS